MNKYIYITLCILLSIALVRQCNVTNKQDKLLNFYKFEKDSLENNLNRFKIENNDLFNVISKKDSIILAQNNVNEKNVKYYQKTVVKIKKDTVYIPRVMIVKEKDTVFKFKKFCENNDCIDIKFEPENGVLSYEFKPIDIYTVVQEKKEPIIKFNRKPLIKFRKRKYFDAQAFGKDNCVEINNTEIDAVFTTLTKIIMPFIESAPK